MVIQIKVMLDLITVVDICAILPTIMLAKSNVLSSLNDWRNKRIHLPGTIKMDKHSKHQHLAF